MQKPGLLVSGLEFWHRAQSRGQDIAHAHPGVELHFCEEGKGFFQSLRTRREMVPGRITLLFAPVFHRVVADHRKVYRRSTLHLPESLVPMVLSLVQLSDHGFLPTRTESLIQFEPLSQDYTEIRRVLQQINKELRSHRGPASPLIPLYLAEMFYYVSRGRGSTDATPADVSPHDQYLVDKACSMIAAQPEVPLSADELAGRLGVSRGHLWRLFNTVLGMGPQEYILRSRMEAAKAHLRSGLSVAEVARRCGYADSSSFSRAFKAHVGVSPRAFLRVSAF